jgi:hypothetical protein
MFYPFPSNAHYSINALLKTSTSYEPTVHNIVISLKAMFHIPHVSNELKSLDYNTGKIENMHFLPMSFDGDVVFEFFLVRRPMGIFK